MDVYAYDLAAFLEAEKNAQSMDERAFQRWWAGESMASRTGVRNVMYQIVGPGCPPLFVEELYPLLRDLGEHDGRT